MITFFDNTDILSVSPSSLMSQIRAIGDQVYENKKNIDETGLLGGKAGITLLYGYLSKLFPEKKHADITFEFMDQLSNALEHETLSHNMSSGVAGIAFVFQHLRNIGVLDITQLGSFARHGGAWVFIFLNGIKKQVIKNILKKLLTTWRICEHWPENPRFGLHQV